MIDTSPLEVLTPLEERVIREKIGNSEWELREIKLNVFDDVALWSDNPRLQTAMMEDFSTEPELEAALVASKGYDNLRKSILEIGQMQSIYVQRTKTGKFLVLEGATRVTILRELDRKYQTGKHEGEFRQVDAKILPSNFGERDIAILLAQIHVRGSGVRAWGRYIEAKFVHETVLGRPGHPAVMNQAQLAEAMGRNESWVSRLKNAYEFALKFIDHIDGDANPPRTAAENFSTLEELSKARGIGPQLRDFDNSAYDELRAEVFEMVRNNVFKEYRDARFLKDFHDDPDTWDQLKSGEKHVANQLARQVQDNSSGPKAKISSLPKLVRRTIKSGKGDFDDDDVAALQQTIDQIEDQVHEGVNPYRLAIKKATRILNKASRADVLDLAPSDLSELKDAYEYFSSIVKSHAPKGGT